MFIIASDESNKGISFFFAEVDKNNGEMIGALQTLTSWEREDKKDQIAINIAYNTDSTRIVIVSSVLGKAQVNYEVRQFDHLLKPISELTKITSEFDSKKFVLEDVVYADNGNLAVVGKVYDYEEGKKQKDRFLQFKNYSIRVYNTKGDLVKEINTEISGKFLLTTKVKYFQEQLILAAFYSNEKRGNSINGLLVQKIDPSNGTILTTTLKDIGTNLFFAPDNKTDTESGQMPAKKPPVQPVDDGFAKNMLFRNFIPTIDKGVVIIAEQFRFHTYWESGSNGTKIAHEVYECGDLMMSKIDAVGELAWIKVLPKGQVEDFRVGSSDNSIFSDGDYFNDAYNRPYFSGVGIWGTDNAINIIFNDQTENVRVLQPGDSYKRVAAFFKADCFSVVLDPLTGQCKRYELFSNTDISTPPIPRLGVALGNDFYMLGKDESAFSKTKVALGRISFKK